MKGARAVVQGIALVALVTALIIGLDVSTAGPARANDNAVISARIVIGGRVYNVEWGKTIVFATQLPDGSRGWIRYRTDLAMTALKHGVGQASPNDPCLTVSGTEQWTDYAGFVLVNYTLYQYWCYDYTEITTYTTAYSRISAYFSWSLANHSEATTMTPPDHGLGTGKFRFNGPLGIGCVSGAIDIYFNGSGGNAVFKYYGGYYGC